MPVNLDLSVSAWAHVFFWQSPTQKSPCLSQMGVEPSWLSWDGCRDFPLSPPAWQPAPSCSRPGSPRVSLNLPLDWKRRRQWHPTPALLPEKSHGQRSLEGRSPWGSKESDATERLHFHFSLSCTGEGNGNPLQCSCLKNPRDRGALWAAVYGVAQSRTQLKRLHNSQVKGDITKNVAVSSMLQFIQIQVFQYCWGNIWKENFKMYN